MSTIDLTRVDEHILKQIVKKFSARSGARFYRSCRGAKELVEFGKPVWPLQSSRLTYFMNKREASKKSSVPGRQKRLKSATVSPPFCKLEEVAVRSCNTDYLQAVILPEVRALGAVGTLEFGLVDGPHIPLLLEAAKPDTISLCHSNHDVRADVYKSVKNLYIDDSMYMDKIYWTTKILFELAQGRDSITLHTCSTSLKKTPISFLKTWLKGESTGTLKQLTVSAHIKTDRPSDEKKAFQRVIAQIVKNKNSTRESYNVERGRDLLHICVSGLRLLKVDFYFS